MKIDISRTDGFYNRTDFMVLKEKYFEASKLLHSKKGPGKDFLGWMELPELVSDESLFQLVDLSNHFREKADYIVVIGIGGSYLGARAVIDALSPIYPNENYSKTSPQILFAGHNISEDYLYELVSFLEDKRFGLVVISKSGTTTEPAIAFRILKEALVNKVGKEKARDYILAITDKTKGALRKMADQEGYKSWIIPDDVGGRFSVFTPVGLLPIALAGYDIFSLLRGALKIKRESGEETPFEKNLPAKYAIIRNILYNNAYTSEICVNYDARLHYFAEWWKQLYGESEGKENKGIFPAAVDFTTDLHSMGQYIQEGRRVLFETTISVQKPKHVLRIPFDENNFDQLNYIAGRRIDEVNKMAETGTMLAHLDGGVPQIRITIPEINEYHLGQLIYFYQKACAISGYLLGVNPFDQPGVEAYKRNMFALLGKPGFEKESEKINRLLK